MSSLYSYLSSPASTQASVEAREFSGEGGGSGFLLFVFVFYIEFALLHIFLYCPHQRQVSIDYRRSRVLRWGRAAHWLSPQSWLCAFSPLRAACLCPCCRSLCLCLFPPCCSFPPDLVQAGNQAKRHEEGRSAKIPFKPSIYEQRWKWKYTSELSFSLPPADSLLRHRQQILCSAGSLNLLCLNDKG